MLNILGKRKTALSEERFGFLSGVRFRVSWFYLEFLSIPIASAQLGLTLFAVIVCRNWAFKKNPVLLCTTEMSSEAAKPFVPSEYPMKKALAFPTKEKVFFVMVRV